jgi:hypothetical protein
MSTDIRGCRLCGSPLNHTVVDLGLSPLCQTVVPQDDLNKGQMFYPLRAFVCDHCWLIQVHDLVSGEEIYSHYAYFSSYSDSWLKHCSDYCDMIVDRLGLDQSSQVIELASNDGYLLQYFGEKGVPALGVEPAANVAQVAIDKGLDCVVRFFGVDTAKELVAQGKKADLLLGNNVIGHVPNLNDFVAGMKILLADQGTITIEIPHAINLIKESQFDTIYQEHYSYFLMLAMRQVFQRHGMVVFDVDEIPTHGGSLRYYARHAADTSRPISPRVEEIQQHEIDEGLTDLQTYRDYSRSVMETKWKLLEFLIKARREGKKVVGYGAPGKAATLLNYCGIREDLIEYTVDRNKMKQNTFLVGTLIPIYAPEMISQTKPDYIVILPWNLKDEIMSQLSEARDWGAKFVVPIPELTLY